MRYQVAVTLFVAAIGFLRQIAEKRRGMSNFAV